MAIDIWKYVTTDLNTVIEDEFSWCFQSLCDHCSNCIRSLRDCFEESY